MCGNCLIGASPQAAWKRLTRPAMCRSAAVGVAAIARNRLAGDELRSRRAQEQHDPDQIRRNHSPRDALQGGGPLTNLSGWVDGTVDLGGDAARPDAVDGDPVG